MLGQDGGNKVIIDLLPRSLAKLSLEAEDPEGRDIRVRSATRGLDDARIAAPEEAA